jgi:hypothetical protein
VHRAQYRGIYDFVLFGAMIPANLRDHP